MYKYLQSTGKRLHPIWVIILASVASDFGESFLKVFHIRRIHHILWKTVVNIHHGEDRSHMQSVLEDYLEEMAIKLFIVLARAERAEDINEKNGSNRWKIGCASPKTLLCNNPNTPIFRRICGGAKFNSRNASLALIPSSLRKLW